MDVAGHVSLVELERLERSERDAAKARRLRIVILAKKGYTAPAVAMSLGLSRRVCQEWVYRYNESGLEGLEDRRGRAPCLPLSPEQQRQVCERIEAGPIASDEVSTLRGSPRLNTKVVNAFLEQFARTIPADEHAVLLWDGAGFHTSKELRVPENISLLQLPPYSPEFNPIENLWHYLKSHFCSNRAYDDYDALEQAAIDAFTQAVLDPALMKTVCAAPYLPRATSN